jgi:hypothetical protein
MNVAGMRSEKYFFVGFAELAECGGLAGAGRTGQDQAPWRPAQARVRRDGDLRRAWSGGSKPACWNVD